MSIFAGPDLKEALLRFCRAIFKENTGHQQPADIKFSCAYKIESLWKARVTPCGSAGMQEVLKYDDVSFALAKHRSAEAHFIKIGAEIVQGFALGIAAPTGGALLQNVQTASSPMAVSDAYGGVGAKGLKPGLIGKMESGFITGQRIALDKRHIPDFEDRNAKKYQYYTMSADRLGGGICRIVALQTPAVPGEQAAMPTECLAFMKITDDPRFFSLLRAAIRGGFQTEQYFLGHKMHWDLKTNKITFK